MKNVRLLLVLFLTVLIIGSLAFAKSNTSTAVSSSLNPSTYGATVKFTATVTPSAATGTVTFKDGSTTLGTGTLSSGKATYSTSTLAVGSHSITAVYGGNSNYNGSTSSVLTQTVNKASTTTTVASSKNPSTFGSSVTFTATVTPSTATGTVTFKDGTTTLGTGTLSGGKATYGTSTLAAGSHSITASYGGDSNDNSSTSSTLTQTVNKASTTTTVASSANPSGYGSPVTFTATVTPSAATGTVTFKDGSTALGTGSLIGGVATYTTSSLAIGSHSITAAYVGDSNDNSSTSSTLTQRVESASSTALTSSANPSPSGALVTFTATVTPSTATGTVTFYDGGTSLGTVTLSGGVAMYGTSSLAVGSHSITAVYGGNTTYAGSTSAPLAESVLTVTSIAVIPSSVSLSVGATLQLVAMATFSNGTQGNITSSATWSSSDVTIVTVSAAGVATGAAEGSASITATLGSIFGSAGFTGTPSKFRLTGSLNFPRWGATSTLLQNGQVLIVGGNDSSSSGYAGASELYNPTTGTFSITGSLNIPRAFHTATLLQNGQILVTGGLGYSNGNYVQPVQAELFDPTTGTFSYTGNLNVARYNHTATLLQDGTVLVAGGSGDATAEIYNPATGLFAYTTGNLTTALSNQAAALLNDGTVFITGGSSSTTVPAELYNPSTQTFSSVGTLNPMCLNPTATLLANGKVLITAGYDTQSGLPVPTSEIYDPTAKTVTLTGSLAYPRANATATLLNSGQVLVVGGGDLNSYSLAPAELYDPTSGTFSLAGNLNIARNNHAAALLNDGTILISGGIDQYQYQGTTVSDYVPQAEIYQTSGQPAPPDSLQITPASANIVIGGTQSFTAVDSNGYPRQDVTWTVSDPSLASVTADENDRGVVIGIAVGQITVTATAENVSGQAQVTIFSGTALPVGTAIWSAPAIPGYSAIQLVQAVPSVGGPDFYSVQLSTDGTKSIVQALTADGQQLWQTPIAAPLAANSVPDGAGGLIVTQYDTCTPGQRYPLSLVDLDPIYGQPTMGLSAAGVQEGNNIVYCYGNGDAPQMAVRGDGALFVAEPTNNGFPPLTEVANGNYVGQYIPPSSDTENGNQISVQCCMGPPIVNTDGTTYVEYEVRNVVDHVITSDSLYLWWLKADDVDGGTALLSSTTQNQALLPGSIIPDGNGGVIATWTISPSNPPVPQFPYQAVDVVGGVVGTPYNLPFSPLTLSFGQYPSLVLGENGMAFAKGSTTQTGTTNIAVDQIASFNLSSGATNWTYQSTPASSLSIIEATSGNGLAARSTDQNGIDTVLLFDSSGNQSQAMKRILTKIVRSMAQVQPGFSGFSNLDYYGNGWWAGTGSSSPVAVLGSVIQLAMSGYAHSKGNSKQSSGLPIVDTFEPVDPAPQWLAVNFPIRYGQTTNLSNVSLSKLTTSVARVNQSASWDKFKNRPQTVQALAFIGHSFDSIAPAPVRGVGLCFAGGYCVERAAVPGDPEYSIQGFDGYSTNPPLVNIVDYPAPSPVFQASIVFIAACNMDANMQSWLGITNNTAGRALLVPQNTTDIDLDMGEYEWLRILAYLTSGKNLQQAVSSANTDVAGKVWRDVNGNVVPPQAWQVVGDSGNPNSRGTGIHF